jgi:hypothetical protein
MPCFVRQLAALVQPFLHPAHAAVISGCGEPPVAELVVKRAQEARRGDQRRMRIEGIREAPFFRHRRHELRHALRTRVAHDLRVEPALLVDQAHEETDRQFMRLCGIHQRLAHRGLAFALGKRARQFLQGRVDLLVAQTLERFGFRAPLGEPDAQFDIARRRRRHGL